ncbi:MAG: hypothetical protein WDN00_12025 [Limisphaerales bacterium]
MTRLIITAGCCNSRRRSCTTGRCCWKKRRDWLAKRGIAYLFVVAPDKHSIYPEELPGWAVKVRPQTKLDQSSPICMNIPPCDIGSAGGGLQCQANPPDFSED